MHRTVDGCPIALSCQTVEDLRPVAPHCSQQAPQRLGLGPAAYGGTRGRNGAQALPPWVGLALLVQLLRWQRKLIGSSRADGCNGASTGKFNAGLPTTYFSEWAEVRAVATKSSLHFVDRSSLPKGIVLYTDDDEWSTWKKIGDEVLHIELRKWADIMVIAPLSANTLAKIAGGLCDNLLTCIVRAWDYRKPLFVAPAMNTFMWNNPFTERHLQTISQLGISLIPPVTKKLACGDYGNGAMAETSQIYASVRLACKPRTHGASSSHMVPVSNDLPSIS